MKCSVCGEEVTGSYIEHMKKHEERPFQRPELKKWTAIPPSLASYIDADIKDEEKAEREYLYLAKQLEDAGFKDFAAGVILIASDEREHKRTLENILRGI